MPTPGIPGSNRTQDDAGYVEYDLRYVGSRSILEGFSYMEPRRRNAKPQWFFWGPTTTEFVVTCLRQDQNV